MEHKKTSVEGGRRSSINECAWIRSMHIYICRQSTTECTIAPTSSKIVFACKLPKLEKNTQGKLVLIGGDEMMLGKKRQKRRRREESAHFAHPSSSDC